MIAATSPTGQPHSFPRTPWQKALADAISSPVELCNVLGLDPALIPGALSAAEGFSLRVPRGFVARMRRHDPRDPL